MASRLYFREAEVPDISPAFDSGWTNTSGSQRRVMSPTTKAGDTITGTAKSSSAGQAALARQYVGPPMVAGIQFTDLVTTFSAWVAWFEGALNNNLRARGVVRIVSQDGGTVRIALAGYSNGSEPTDVRNFQRFLSTTQNAGASYTTVLGDRLVVEFGHTDVVGSSPNGTYYWGSDSGAAQDYPGLLEFSANATDRPWFETDAVLGFVGESAVGHSERRLGSVDVICTIDGAPVQLEDWNADMVTDHGYRSLTGGIPRNFLRAEQDAPVVLWQSDGEPLWSGRLAQDPRPSESGWDIRGEGYAEDLSGPSPRLLYRLDGAAEFQDSEGDPYGYGNSEKFDILTGPGRIIWKVGDGSTAYATGDQAAVVLWAEGADITRYSILAEVSVNFGNLDIQTHIAHGPSGTRNLEGTHGLSIVGTPTTYARTLTVQDDLLSIRLRASNPFTPGARQRVKLTAIKVYGRTNDDDFSASEVVTDAASFAGLDTSGVRSNTQPILPLDWTEDLASLLSYMAELVGWRWVVVHGDGIGQGKLDFGPYERTWTAYAKATARPDLQPLQRFNEAVVPFRALSGAMRSVTAYPGVNPFPGKTRSFTADELEHPQSDDGLATAYASVLAEYNAERHYAGRIELGSVLDDKLNPVSPYKARAGDLISLPDYPGVTGQRIASVTYQPGEKVSVDVGDDFHVVRVLADLRRDLPRRHRRRRHRVSRLPSPFG